MASPNIFGLSGSNVNWEQMLEKIMKAYEKRLEIYRLNEWEAVQQMEAWKMLRKKLQDLRSAARFLYDPIRGPFSSLKVESTDERALSATAERTAKAGKHKIEVLNVASADSIQSDPLKLSTTLDSATFTIGSGDKKFKINFGGGSINSLAEVINRVAGEIVHANVMNIDDENVALIIEGKKQGIKHKLFFEDVSPMLLKIGLLEMRSEDIVTVKFDNPQAFRTREGTVQFNEGVMVLTPKSKSERLLNEDLRVLAGHILQFEARMISLSQDSVSAVQRTTTQNGTTGNGTRVNASGVNIGSIDQTEVGPYRIHGQHLINSLPGTPGSQQQQQQNNNQQNQTQQQAAGTDTHIIILQNGPDIIKKIPVENLQQWKKYRIPLNDIAGKTIDRIIFVNTNTNKQIEIRTLSVSDDREKLKAKNYISRASDAVLRYNGVKITRQSNDIDKLIPGVTVNIKRRTNGPETITLDYDYEKLAKTIEEFVIHYNNTMDYIYTVTKYQRRKELKDRLEHKKKMEALDDEKKNQLALSGKLFEGLLAGDMTIQTIKRKIREVMMSPYPTPAGEAVRFFIQIGLQNPTFSANASVEEKRNMQAGYFEFKKEKFIEMLRKNYESVRDFFASDTNGDLVRDEGLSIRMSTTLQYIAATNYRAENGRVYPSILENRISVAQLYIKDRQKRTKNFEKQMSDKRARFINQIRRAEQAETRSQSIRARLGAFGGNQQGGR